MMSDALFDAIETIEHYQQEHPLTYRKYEVRLRKIKEEMKKIQLEIDLEVITKEFVQ